MLLSTEAHRTKCYHKTAPSTTLSVNSLISCLFVSAAAHISFEYTLKQKYSKNHHHMVNENASTTDTKKQHTHTLLNSTMHWNEWNTWSSTQTHSFSWIEIKQHLKCTFIKMLLRFDHFGWDSRSECKNIAAEQSYMPIILLYHKTKVVVRDNQKKETDRVRWKNSQSYQPISMQCIELNKIRAITKNGIWSVFVNPFLLQ